MDSNPAGKRNGPVSPFTGKKVAPLRDVDLAEKTHRRILLIKLAIPGSIMLGLLFTVLYLKGFIPLPTYKFLLLMLPALIWLLAQLLRVGIEKASHGLVGVLMSSGGDPVVPGYSAQEALVVRGKITDAISSYRERIDALPEDIGARIRLASLLAGNGELEEAQEWLETARALDTKSRHELVISDALVNIHQESGNRAALKAELARMARSFPGPPAGRGAADSLRKLVSESRSQEESFLRDQVT